MMLKPLSPKTLEKRYKETNITMDLLEQLQTYFLCFSNLYGVISGKEAFQIYSFYEPEGVKKVKFRRFVEVAARDTKPYVIVDIAELYDEKPGSDYLIINKKLISEGYYKWYMVYQVVNARQNKPFYMPEKKVLLKWEKDQFWLSDAAIRYRQFIENLRSSGTVINKYTDKEKKLLDINGDSASGKKLDELLLINDFEQFDIKHIKNEKVKDKRLEQASIPVSEKILNETELEIRAGSVIPESDGLRVIMDKLIYEYGVVFTEQTIRTFTDLFVSLNNTSCMWLSRGHSPEEIRKEQGTGGHPQISFGPNIRELISKGEFDIDDIRKAFAVHGIDIDESDFYINSGRKPIDLQSMG